MGADDIDIESRPGQGSTFSFAARFGHSARTTTPAWLTPQEKLKGKRVLVVDDNEMNRDIFREMVLGWGMVCLEAADGPAALAAVAAAAHGGAPFDLVLLDVQMPGMSGFTVAEQIHATAPAGSIKIIVLSSIGQRGEGARSVTAGISAYLVKPVRKADLLDTVRMVLFDETSQEDAAARLVTRHTIREARKNGGFRILLAEDDPINRQVALMMLGKYGHQVTVAENGAEAVALYRRQDFDIILMDVQMPEMDGFEATRSIRELSADKPCPPIIAMTAHALAGDRERCLAAGMDDYLSKPIKPESVSAAIARWTSADRAMPTQDVAQVPETPPPTGAEPVQMAKALERAMGNAEFLEEMLGEFARRLPDYLSAIRTAVQQADADGLRQAAHRLKGAAANLSADEITEATSALERSGRHQTLVEAPQQLEQLIKAAERCQAFIDQQAGQERGMMAQINVKSPLRQEDTAATAALRESEERFRLISETLPVGIFETTPDGECLYTNTCWQDLFGLSLVDTYTCDWRTLLHPDDRKEVIDGWHRAIEEIEAFDRTVASFSATARSAGST